MPDRPRVGKIIFRLVLFAGLLASSLSATFLPVTAARPESRKHSLDLFKVDINSMTTEEKIGQLFLITFNGNDLGENSQIFDLIANRHIGGVLLESRNDNFSGPENVLQTTYNLTSGLQTIAGEVSELAGEETFLPLFIAISQNGDRAPLDQLISGMTPLPNQLALGATWNPVLAENTGHVLGEELSALGFNMFLGPSLDVLDNVPSGGSEDLGAQVFGGDPYWVGVLGQAYIRGLHEGSNKRLAVISKNFPGRGGSDQTIRRRSRHCPKIIRAAQADRTGSVFFGDRQHRFAGRTNGWAACFPYPLPGFPGKYPCDHQTGQLRRSCVGIHPWTGTIIQLEAKWRGCDQRQPRQPVDQKILRPD